MEPFLLIPINVYLINIHVLDLFVILEVTLKLYKVNRAEMNKNNMYKLLCIT